MFKESNSTSLAEMLAKLKHTQVYPIHQAEREKPTNVSQKNNMTKYMLFCDIFNPDSTLASIASKK